MSQEQQRRLYGTPVRTNQGVTTGVSDALNVLTNNFAGQGGGLLGSLSNLALTADAYGRGGPQGAQSFQTGRRRALQEQTQTLREPVNREMAQQDPLGAELALGVRADQLPNADPQQEVPHMRAKNIQERAIEITDPTRQAQILKGELTPEEGSKLAAAAAQYAYPEGIPPDEATVSYQATAQGAYISIRQREQNLLTMEQIQEYADTLPPDYEAIPVPTGKYLPDGRPLFQTSPTRRREGSTFERAYKGDPAAQAEVDFSLQQRGFTPGAEPPQRELPRGFVDIPEGGPPLVTPSGQEFSPPPKLATKGGTLQERAVEGDTVATKAIELSLRQSGFMPENEVDALVPPAGYVYIKKYSGVVDSEGNKLVQAVPVRANQGRTVEERAAAGDEIAVKAIAMKQNLKARLIALRRGEKGPSEREIRESEIEQEISRYENPATSQPLTLDDFTPAERISLRGAAKGFGKPDKGMGELIFAAKDNPDLLEMLEKYQPQSAEDLFASIIENRLNILDTPRAEAAARRTLLESAQRGSESFFKGKPTLPEEGAPEFGLPPANEIGPEHLAPISQELQNAWEEGKVNQVVAALTRIVVAVGSTQEDAINLMDQILQGTDIPLDQQQYIINQVFENL